MKRTDYISWEEYFMGIAILSSKRSKDPNRQVGACIVGKDNRIISMGYNGFPKGCSDNEYPWDKVGNPLDTKYMYVVHAELNAILNARGKCLEGTTLYVTLFPCNECTKAIIQSGIERIIYLDNKHDGTDSVLASKRMLISSSVHIEQYHGKVVKIDI